MLGNRVDRPFALLEAPESELSRPAVHSEQYILYGLQLVVHDATDCSWR